MEIKKFNDMKAYLLKPKRLFTSKQDTIGGGIIQGDTLDRDWETIYSPIK